jgi:general secretion pathway protein A
LVNTLCDRALRFCYEANKTTVDLDCVRRAADDIGLGSEVFLWLMNLKKKAKQAELQDSSLPDTSPAPASNQFEPIEKEQKRVDRKKAINEWFDKTIWMLADSPLLLLFISTLLFAVSLWFYKVYTGG